MSIVDGERVEIAYSDLNGYICCYRENGSELELNGTYTAKEINLQDNEDGAIEEFCGTFEGNIVVNDIAIRIKIDFKGPLGYISILNQEEDYLPVYILRSNPVYAVLEFPTGEKTVIWRHPDLDWDYKAGVFGTRINGKDFLFSVQ